MVYAPHSHGAVSYGSRNADGAILEFADGLNVVICNTLFTKQEAKLVTYVAGPVKSTHTHTHTTVYRPFVRDYPGRPVHTKQS